MKFRICMLMTMGVILFAASTGLAEEVQKERRKRVKGPTLPVLEVASKKGEAGTHAVYSTDLLTARVAANGDLLILPTATSEGTGILHPIRVAAECYFPEGRRRKRRPVVQFTDPSPAANQPASVTIHRVHAQDVESTITYTFKKNEIQVDSEFKDPSGLKPPSYIWFVARIPASHEFAPEADVEERSQYTEGLELHLLGKAVAYEKLKGPKGNLEKGATIIGHWPGREVEVSFKDGGQFHHYSFKPLYEGYGLVAKSEAGRDRQRMKIRVE